MRLHASRDGGHEGALVSQAQAAVAEDVGARSRHTAQPSRAAPNVAACMHAFQCSDQKLHQINLRAQCSAADLDPDEAACQRPDASAGTRHKL
eukprot:1161470-Pelagomonas_calceolata.AAC.9